MRMLDIPSTNTPADDLIKSSIQNTVGQKRETIIKELLESGYVPSHMRTFVEIPIIFSDKQGVSHKLVISVLPDYLMIGNDQNHVRVPLWPLTAQKIADNWNCVLPTTKLVSIIWGASNKISPQPWGPPYDSSMQSVDRFLLHNDKIEKSILKLGYKTGDLLAGHKKDVVITKKLINKPDAVAIFGWHQLNGQPIQPLYLGHSNVYCDYSHGIRLISKECFLDDQKDDLSKIMQNADLCNSISSEGPMTLVRQPLV